MLRRTAFCAVLAFVGLAPSIVSQAIDTIRVAQALSSPVYCGAPAGDYERLFIIEQYTARIRILKNGTLLPIPFLDINSLVIGSGDERGLLGMAFHPNYAQNGYYYVNYISNSGTTIVARYQRSPTNPDISDTVGTTFLAVGQPFSNHNGGCLKFGPDGYLYIGMGDGGSSNDPNGNAQNLNSFLGKMLRINVDQPSGTINYSIPPGNPFAGSTAGLDEIWSYGLRNPWRFSFDRLTGEMYIGDVGQNAIEEISYQPAINPAMPALVAGRNYGWRCREGNSVTSNQSGCPTTGFVPPIYQYAQGGNGFCVVGGYVYRGCAIPAMWGTYFFADYSSAQIWSFRYDGTTVTQFTNRTADLTPGGGLSINAITSFGEDGQGELYLVKRGSASGSTGEIYKVVPAATVPQIATLSLAGTPTIGTTVNLNLSSPTDASRDFLIGFSLGTLPGIPLSDGRTIPLALDPLLEFSLTPGNGVFVNTSGTLSATGTATAQVIIPPEPALVNLDIFAAAVVAFATAPSGIDEISCALRIRIQ